MKPPCSFVAILLSLVTMSACHHPNLGALSAGVSDTGTLPGQPELLTGRADPTLQRTGIALQVQPTANHTRRIQAWVADIGAYQLKLKSSLLPEGELAMTVAAANVSSANGVAQFSIRNLLPTESGSPESQYDIYIKILDRGGTVVNARNDEGGYALIASDVPVVPYEMTELPSVSIMLLTNYAPHPSSFQSNNTPTASQDADPLGNE